MDRKTCGACIHDGDHEVLHASRTFEPHGQCAYASFDCGYAGVDRNHANSRAMVTPTGTPQAERMR